MTFLLSTPGRQRIVPKIHFVIKMSLHAKAFHTAFSLSLIAMSFKRCAALKSRDQVNIELAAALADPSGAFLNWTQQFNYSYIGAEFEHRLGIFLDSVNYCISYNANDTEAYLGLGPFNALTNAEFLESYHGYNIASASPNTTIIVNGRRSLQQSYYCTKSAYNQVSTIPEAIDWTQSSAGYAVTLPVQNQGQCGNCWAWSAMEAVASLDAIVTKSNAQVLSTQAITSCTSGTTGCSNCSSCGGNPQDGFQYVLSNGGLPSATTYPFVGWTGYNATPGALDTDTCSNSLEKSISVTISGYCTLPPDSADALQSAVAYQPVSTGIAASSAYFQYYQGGILTSSSLCGTSLDHAILTVGYDMTAPTPYWKLQNQWGSNWGMDGYVLISAASSVPAEGVCGMYRDLSIPIKSSSTYNPPQPPSPPPGASQSINNEGITSVPAPPSPGHAFRICPQRIMAGMLTTLAAMITIRVITTNY
ncbi:hypothetical protein CEUSTIGMA_g12280.t1 [Chlamydomonas eustigma]|uniref:Peptidase C1A papain C-terminal domain-containing protein n=1 Tax=Chlamydomonas eustigma TaxID=1157962 RepID=A0A250XPI6_9CHLO|nr:hypothetical protein CEUSTIGMA_g12280.t1 [Chlamydomonas eustigma]|eukprot:GAX84859.1 hypothetical protein CEUSTIGMA_g12280.t1 [Chlamydomonas eustigma]